MAEEITEIDRDKYIVFKRADIEKHPFLKADIDTVIEQYKTFRKMDGKPTDTPYLVLNMDDNIGLWGLREDLGDLWDSDVETVKDIAVVLVNQIIKANED